MEGGMKRFGDVSGQQGEEISMAVVEKKINLMLKYIINILKRSVNNN